jgi:RNA polymerase sigma factor (sigma-70 family)
MAGNEARAVGQLLRLAAPPEDDALLLRRFLTAADAGAFAELVRRHGPMVLGVCRRVLGNAADADDAFQAAFIVLARRGDSIRSGRSVASWLFGVARFAALRARDKARRRRGHEAKAGSEPRPAAGADPELLAAVDEELQRLPEKYRSPLVSCFLRGLTQEEAARDTGVSLSTLRRRLERGQAILRERLAGRGAVPALGALAAATGGAALPADAVEATTAVVVAVLTDKVAATPAAILAEGVVATMTRTKLKVLAALLAAAALTGGGLAWQLAAAQPPRPVADAPPAPKPADPKADRIRPGDKLTIRAEQVFAQAPLDQIFEVDADGNIDLGEMYAGKVKVAGLTLPEADAAVTKKLRVNTVRGTAKLSRFVPAKPLELEQRVRQLEKEVKELRREVEELRIKR